MNSSRKKFKKSDNKDLDEAVTSFKNVRSNNIPVNGIIIKEKDPSQQKALS